MKKQLNKLNACNEAVNWVGEKDLKTAWQECERGDWMLWYLQKTELDIRKLTLIKAECANLVKHLMEDERSKKAVDAAIAFGNGEISRTLNITVDTRGVRS